MELRRSGRDLAGGQGALAAKASTLTLGQATPDAELLAVRERVLEALQAHDAATADLLGLTGGRPALGEEEVGIDPEAVRLVLPVLLEFFSMSSCSASEPDALLVLMLLLDPLEPDATAASAVITTVSLSLITPHDCKRGFGKPPSR
jgi:hypothetical protein